MKTKPFKVTTSPYKLFIEAVDRGPHKITVHSKFGDYQRVVTKKYKKPKLVIDFVGYVEPDGGGVLEVNGMYLGENDVVYICTAPNTIINVTARIDRFSLPQELILISQPHIAK